MPSNHLYTIRRTILIGPIIAFFGGFGLTFLVPEMNLWGPYSGSESLSRFYTSSGRWPRCSTKST